MTRAEHFLQLRPLLFAIAYRLLGSVSEAEDAVQETWLHYAAYPTEPTSARSFLATVVTRVSINVLRSARSRREEYVGEWFPEPLLTDPYADPERSAELAGSVSMAALLLLERLTPLERAVFVLREVFAFGFGEVAAAVGRSESACRQLAVRARRHMDAGRPRFEADGRARDELADRFFDAFRDGDLDGLRELLSADVQMVSDGGGQAPQLPRPIIGADRVARVLATVGAPFARIGVRVEPRPVNGQPGAVVRDRDGRLVNALTLDILDGQIQAIRVVANPGKLRAEWVLDFSPGALRVIGALELLAVAGLILPAVTGVAPVLVPVTATCVAGLFLGATIMRLRRGERATIVSDLVYLALAVFVAWGRFGPAPLAG